MQEIDKQHTFRLDYIDISKVQHLLKGTIRMSQTFTMSYVARASQKRDFAGHLIKAWYLL